MAVDDCVRCGTHTVPDASFCHRCGLRLDVLVADVDLFAPPGSHPQGYADDVSPGERLKTTLGVVGVLALIALAVAYVGSVDGEADAEDAAAEESVEDDGAQAGEDSPDAEDIVHDDEESGSEDGIVARSVGRLTVLANVDVGQGWPVGVTQLGDEAMVFISPRESYLQRNAGLDLWVGPDFNTLTKVAGVIPAGVDIEDVEGSPDGLIAVGGDSEGSLMVWRSVDGREWTSEVLPVPDIGPDLLFTGSQIVVGPAGVGVAVNRGFGGFFGDSTSAVLDYFGLPAEAVDDFQVWEEHDSATLVGPFGFEFASATLEELGLPERPVEGQPSPVLWMFDDGSGWESQDFETPWLQSLGVDEEGHFYASEWRGPGTQLLRSVDGHEWVETDLNSDADSVVPWQDGILRGTPFDLSLLVGDSIDHIGLRDIAPTAGADGSYINLVLRADGVAVTYRSWSNPQVAGPVSATLLKRDYSLTTEDGWSLELRQGDTIVWSQSGPGPAGPYTADVQNRTVTLLDQESGEELIEFSIDELRHLSQSSQVFEKSVPDQLLFSYDLEDWYRGVIGSVSEPASAWFRGAEHVGDSLAIFGYRSTHTPWGTAAPDVELWVFELPPEGQ